MKVLRSLAGREVSLFGGGPLKDAKFQPGQDVVAAVHGGVGSLLEMGVTPDLVFVDEWILRRLSDPIAQLEQAERLTGFADTRLLASDFVVIRSSPRAGSLELSRIPHFRSTSRLGISALRRKCWTTLRDLRIGSFPDFRLSTGMSAAILILSAGASSVNLYGFDSNAKHPTRNAHSHVMADTYAVILEARLGGRLKFQQGSLSSVQSNWGGATPEWAKKTVASRLVFSGLFWW